MRYCPLVRPAPDSSRQVSPPAPGTSLKPQISRKEAASLSYSLQSSQKEIIPKSLLGRIRMRLIVRISCMFPALILLSVLFAQSVAAPSQDTPKKLDTHLAEK